MMVESAPVSVEMSLLSGVIETSPVASVRVGLDIAEERIEPRATVGWSQLDESKCFTDGLGTVEDVGLVGAMAETMVLVVIG